jgi:hypothetical protein
MTRYPDAYKAGQSQSVPFTPNAGERHDARLQAANERQAEAVRRCDGLDIGLTISNEGHHWQFRGGDGWRADWWPSSAKLVIGQQWHRGIHAHDLDQVMEMILARRQKRG